MNELNALARRVEQLEAVDAIKALKYRYLNACDEKQPERVLACFAPGPVTIDFGHIGQFDSREAFVEVFKELGCHEHIVDMHHAQNPLVELQGQDRATAKICLRFLSINTRDKTRIQLGGHYDDQFQRLDGEWLITASRFTVTAVEIQDFGAERAVVTYAGNRMPGA